MSKRLTLIIMVGAFMCLPLASAWAELLRIPSDVAYYNPAKAYNGVTVFSQASSKNIFMIDMDGRVVKRWTTLLNSSWQSRLEENGTISSCGAPGTNDARGTANWSAGGVTGGLEELNWDGTRNWYCATWDADAKAHHDYIRIWNNKLQQYTYLVVMWTRLTRQASIDAGATRPPSGDVGADAVYEYMRTGPTTGVVVWRWRFQDHLCQSVDSNKANYYPDVFQAPQKFDVNTTNLQRNGPVTDWQHINAIGYNQELGLVVMNGREQNEFYVFDHDKTFVSDTDWNANFAEAAGTKGDMLYRFGQPSNYHAPNFMIGTTSYSNTMGFNTNGSTELWGAHGCHFIPKYAYTGGPLLPGGGNILLFDNYGDNWNPLGSYSQLLEINPYVNGGTPSSYTVGPTMVWPHDVPMLNASTIGSGMFGYGYVHQSRQVVWKWRGKSTSGIFAGHISGSQRLPNGNSLACAAETSHMVEVTAGTGGASEPIDGTSPEVVWDYNFPSLAGTPPASPKFYSNVAGASATFRCYRYGLDHPGLKDAQGNPRVIMNTDFSMYPADTGVLGANLSNTVPCRSIPCDYQ